jgi:hypothetical protein
MRSSYSQTRKQDIKRRAKEPTLAPARKCSALGCLRLTQRSSGKGLSESHCKQHVEFHRRHGSYWQKSYSATQLAPYRRAAQSWLRSRANDREVHSVITALDALLSHSGPPERAHDLRGLSPERRARIALARVRQAGIRGERLLEITLTIKAIMSDLGPRADPEFMQVQIAKLVHRLASGTHKTRSGFPMRSKYPRAEGRVMRVLGNEVEDIAGIAADAEAVRDVIASVKAAAR